MKTAQDAVLARYLLAIGAPAEAGHAGATMEAPAARPVTPPAQERLFHWTDNEWECRIIMQMLMHAQTR